MLGRKTVLEQMGLTPHFVCDEKELGCVSTYVTLFFSIGFKGNGKIFQSIF
jgi:hypothetical protein